MAVLGKIYFSFVGGVGAKRSAFDIWNFKGLVSFFVIGNGADDSFAMGPTSGRVVTLETGRREVPGSNTGRACRPSCSEFSVVFSETRVNTG